MPSNNKPTGDDQPTTYMVDSKKKAEIHRLIVQDNLVTNAMGGVLAEQVDTPLFHTVLDIGCGPGGWILKMARSYPQMSLTGVDINSSMLEYAREQAQAEGLQERLEFREMDVLHGLDFPDNSFDLVNLRFGVSYVRTWDWLKLLFEMQRVAQPDGTIRVTECEVGTRTTSPASSKIADFVVQAMYRAGYLFTKESTGLMDHLQELLQKSHLEEVQTKYYPLQLNAGTAEGQLFIEDMSNANQAVYPFVQKWTGIAKQEYMALCQQAHKEMTQPDFTVTWPQLVAWGKKPVTK